MLQNFIAFDLEMPSQNEPAISAIGITVVKNGKIAERVYSLINPETKFSDYVIDLIGITPAMVKDAPTLPEYWEKVRKYFESGELLVAHSAYGDLLTFVLALERYGISWQGKINYLCTCDMTLAESPDLEHHTLDYLCENLGIELTHHNAQSDSDGCAEILLKYLENGLDWGKYVKTESGEEIVKAHHRKKFSHHIKSVSAKCKKKYKAAKGNLSLEKRICARLKTGPKNLNVREIEQSLVRSDCRVLGINDEFIRRISRQLSIEDCEEILDRGIFFNWEMYRVYISLFNRFDFDGDAFLTMLCTLPSYNALEGINIDYVCDAFESFELDDTILLEELVKRNIYGCTALAVYIIIEKEYWQDNPDETLAILSGVVKNKFSSEPVLQERYSFIIAKLMVMDGYDEKIKSRCFPNKAMKQALEKAIILKPSKGAELQAIYQ